MADKPIYVTQPYLPELKEFIPFLERIWASHHLTNSGPYHEEFERALGAFLGVEFVSPFTNATLALLTSLQALRVRGEVITTPYSFVATSHVLLWNGLSPVFVDIDPHTFNIDADKIEAAITPATTAILAVHVYGRPCDVEKIEEVAGRRGLKVIYDAAHAFGVTVPGRSLFSYGDMSVLSFHATKVFNTFEGGAVISPSAEMKLHVDRLKNFGIADEVTVIEAGINGKMNEFQAALGILQLKHVRAAIGERRRIHDIYTHGLAGHKGIALPVETNQSGSNFGYFPILVSPEFKLSRDELYSRLAEHGIFTRRYFYPLISEFPMYCRLPSAARSNLPVAHRISSQVLCLPLYPALRDQDVSRICQLIVDAGS